MPLTSSPPIDLLSIQNEFAPLGQYGMTNYGGLSGAGYDYLGRTNCNMLEFLGASGYSFDFKSVYQANGEADGPFGNNASAFVYFSSNGKAYEGGHSEFQPGSYDGSNESTWLIRGNAALVEGYVYDVYITGDGNAPAAGSWYPVGNIGVSCSAPTYQGYDSSVSITVDWRYNGGPVIATSILDVSARYVAYNGGGGNFGYNYSGPSDIRLKRDIVLLETRADGIKVYSFRYKTSEEYYIGVMAQDLLGTQWESAVGTGADGMYWVDYSKLPVKFELLKK